MNYQKLYLTYIESNCVFSFGQKAVLYLHDDYSLLHFYLCVKVDAKCYILIFQINF